MKKLALLNQPSRAETTPLTLADFISLRITFVDSSKRSVYSTRSTELSRFADLSANDGNLPKAKALRVLADICRVRWSNSYSCFSKAFENINNSFDKSTHQAIAEYCKTDNLDFWLQARLAEFAYMLQPRTEFASIALLAYAKAPLNWEAWYQGGSAFWLRALELEKIRGVRPISPSIKERLLDAALNQPDGTPYQYTAQLATIFYTQRIKITNGELLQLSSVLHACATACSDECSDYQAAELYDLLAKWHQQKQNVDACAQFNYKAANAWIRAGNAHPDLGAAARIYENAIASLHAIPQKYRGAWNECNHLKFPVDTLIDRLKRIITQEKQLGHNGMQKFNFGIHVNKDLIVAEAEKVVTGVSLHDDLDSLAQAVPVPSLAFINRQAKEQLANSITSHLGTQTHLTSTGNISAVVPPTSSGDGDTDSPALQKAKVDAFCLNASLSIGVLHEALVQIRAAHPNAIAANFELYCETNCAAIPANQRQQWGVALFAGYKGDWIIAIHLIAPLCESLVRNVLFLNTGQRYTIKNKDGSDNEPSLNTLLEKEELKKALGEDLIFALDTLFCNGLGSNFRNQVAHGLLTDERCKTSLIAYAWWLVISMASSLKSEQSRQAEISA